MAVQSDMQGLSNNTSLPKNGGTRHDFSTVWYIEQRAKAAATKKLSIISVEQVFCISRLVVRNILVNELCIHSRVLRSLVGS